ncbi:hypothetical protein [Mycobacterium sp. 3519A]|uniref:hypothetical protein n=1 Tax=Mycobacterium sp. 3519A TaxID=2057184 RepID=UPI00190E6548|nr:hypothetical protein [Mycobacterium sp. 3519A]
MRDRSVRLLEGERRDTLIPDVEHPGPDESDRLGNSDSRVHPLPADCHRVAHQPGIGQRQIVTAEHAHTAHQHDASVLTDGHRRRAHDCRWCVGWKHVEHDIDRIARCRLHRAPVGFDVAGELDRRDPVAKPGLQIREHGFVPPRADDFRRAGGRNRTAGGTPLFERAGGVRLTKQGLVMLRLARVAHTARDWLTKLALVATGCGMTTVIDGLRSG